MLEIPRVTSVFPLHRRAGAHRPRDHTQLAPQPTMRSMKADEGDGRNSTLPLVTENVPPREKSQKEMS